MQFEFYVLNYDFNKKAIEMFNIFQNISVQNATEKEIKKYLRNKKQYKYVNVILNQEIYGFDGLCVAIDRIIAWQEQARCEYELAAGYKFCTDISELQAVDCYDQAHANIKTIVRDCIYQYKQQRKK